MDLIDESIIEMLNKLEEATGKNIKSQLLTLFTESTPQQIESMKQALQSESFDDLMNLAHSLKSSCGNIGAGLLSRKCAEIEKNIFHDNYSVTILSKLISEIEQNYSASVEKLLAA